METGFCGGGGSCSPPPAVVVGVWFGLEGGEGRVLRGSGLIAGGRPHGDRDEAGGGSGGTGVPGLNTLGRDGGRRVQAPPGLQGLGDLHTDIE